MTKLVSILGFDLECGMTKLETRNQKPEMKLETRNQKPERALLVSGFWFLVSILVSAWSAR
jgi:hypothetical protein